MHQSRLEREAFKTQVAGRHHQSTTSSSLRAPCADLGGATSATVGLPFLTYSPVQRQGYLLE